ncbi:hypothetical protein GCM10011504_52190 [Siccirubricoccus deserti]|nr:hypothetical protein GCM10011504_52190 [Siccirubricoccus deserti]
MRHRPGLDCGVDGDAAEVLSPPPHPTAPLRRVQARGEQQPEPLRPERWRQQVVEEWSSGRACWKEVSPQTI